MQQQTSTNASSTQASAALARLAERRGALAGARMLRYRQVAAMLGVSERTVWGLCKRGELPAVRIAGSVRILDEDVRAFIDARRGAGHQPQESIA